MPLCSVCKQEKSEGWYRVMDGGLTWSSYLKAPPPSFDEFICSSEECGHEDARRALEEAKVCRAKAAEQHRSNSQCIYEIAWRGLCTNLATEGDFCAEHAEILCSWPQCFKDKKHAVKECNYTGGVVCGMPICEEHEECAYHASGTKGLPVEEVSFENGQIKVCPPE